MTFLCISCYFKGVDFMRACKAAGNTVFLLTNKKLEDAAWPREAIDEFFYMEDDSNTPENFGKLAGGMAWLLRSRTVDRIVALDDFDVEKAAYLREEFRIPGMGQTTARLFRDKLAMRQKAAEEGIPVPPFSSLFNDEAINQFAANVPAPWVVKPRAEASATGIRKVHSAEELWRVIHELGDKRHQYLVEQFKPGNVYHADALSVDGKVIFCRVSRYLDTPFEVAHGGGIFRSHTVPFGGDDDRALKILNTKVMEAFGMRFSASHTEYIKSNEDGKFYFLETSSRVGGAHLAEMVEASSGINLWAEWAKIETAMATESAYQLPLVREDYAGIIVSLSRFEWPDLSVFDDAEIVWRMNKKHHVGLIVRAETRERVLELLDKYAQRIFNDFHASAPAPDKPTH
ncbi:ATP-grasp domain-containing protein [Flavilitoribacter nigricans]|uniref:ATPase n=1 Tax=Flavilitoribacter nigricans (strain ATCC 23147 / DSM 23189 / NBRC 102662 / NCIMB 1420 / SS-2) TaxID=1122177 RepID=A0A2D0NG20_FLAN2|nr:ATP-grasp domain-containing protein [Flavilitoribacter nigricans]PHN07358.1 ATPase [Flavilitoribacter nigricans DSM 23189 = NBRC 102662]